MDDDGASVERHEVERGDFIALLHLVRYDEGTAIAPAAGCRRHTVVDFFFGAAEDVGQLLVGRAPGLEYRICRDVGTEDLADRAKERRPDDGVVVPANPQRDMLVDDRADEVSKSL